MAALKYTLTLSILALAPMTAVHANCENPRHIDRYGTVDRSNMAHGGVDSYDCLSPQPDKPLFTRIGTLACQTLREFEQADTVRAHDWALIPLAGMTYHGRTPPAHDGRGTPEFFGCTVQPDGIPIKLLGQGSGGILTLTNLGWLAIADLRNSAEDQKAIKDAQTRGPAK